jgi:sugar phosphate isomerase/epimerase
MATPKSAQRAAKVGPVPCITISLVPEAMRGPFVLHGDLASCMQQAHDAGFRAIEIFARSADELDERELRAGLRRHRLTLAALGTGAGFLVRRLHLLDADPARRAEARRFIQGIIDLAGRFGAPAIIGSMRGRFGPGRRRRGAEAQLAEDLATLARSASRHGTTLLLEPLNRYESDCVNTLAEGAALIARSGAPNLRLLADCFHMNIEERSIPAALRQAAGLVGHIHFVDSNRRAAGAGHLDFAAIGSALRDIAYAGHLSAEALPLPTAQAAARLTLATFTRDIIQGTVP